MRRDAALILIAVIAAALTGCVRRTLTINSDPPGALLWLNGREVGRTPIDVDFLYYGDYDVELVKDGYEPLITNGKANAPWWDITPIDFFAEITPGETKSHITWNFTLQPRNDDPNALIERAHGLRQKSEASTQPDR